MLVLMASLISVKFLFNKETVNSRLRTFSRKCSILMMTRDFPSGSEVKNLLARPEMQETWVQSLGWEDPLEKEMAVHSNTLA